MTDRGEEEARSRLRERQGAGARYDSPLAPSRDLLWARRGTAYFARKLNELSDAALDAPSRVPGWSRRHVIAHVGYHARGLARLVEAARNGAAEESLAEPANQIENVEFGATLPAHALRYLFQHSTIHLNVEWRDLSVNGWRESIRSFNGELVSIRKTPWMRAREIWIRAVDLDNEETFSHFPAAFLDALLEDVVEGWTNDPFRPPGLILTPTDREKTIILGRNGSRVFGTMADIVQWLYGRGTNELICSDGDLSALSAFRCSAWGIPTKHVG